MNKLYYIAILCLIGLFSADASNFTIIRYSSDNCLGSSLSAIYQLDSCVANPLYPNEDSGAYVTAYCPSGSQQQYIFYYSDDACTQLVSSSAFNTTSGSCTGNAKITCNGASVNTPPAFPPPSHLIHYGYCDSTCTICNQQDTSVVGQCFPAGARSGYASCGGGYYGLIQYDNLNCTAPTLLGAIRATNLCQKKSSLSSFYESVACGNTNAATPALPAAGLDDYANFYCSGLLSSIRVPANQCVRVNPSTGGLDPQAVEIQCQGNGYANYLQWNADDCSSGSYSNVSVPDNFCLGTGKVYCTSAATAIGSNVIIVLMVGLFAFIAARLF